MKHINGLRSEKGAVAIIEATFVFPVVLFIVFFMIMAGEAYYQRARVECAVTEAAINGAARCENPMLSASGGGSIPTDPSAADIMPYRYIFTGEASRIAAEVASELEKTVSSMEPLLFRNMSPTNVSVYIDPQMNILISSFPVECEFDIELPIGMIFTDERLKFSYSVCITTSVGDPAEFIRNVATVQDIVERNAKLTEMCGKIKEALDRVGAYTN